MKVSFFLVETSISISHPWIRDYQGEGDHPELPVSHAGVQLPEIQDRRPTSLPFGDQEVPQSAFPSELRRRSYGSQLKKLFHLLHQYPVMRVVSNGSGTAGWKQGWRDGMPCCDNWNSALLMVWLGSRDLPLQSSGTDTKGMKGGRRVF